MTKEEIRKLRTGDVIRCSCVECGCVPTQAVRVTLSPHGLLRHTGSDAPFAYIYTTRVNLSCTVHESMITLVGKRL